MSVTRLALGLSIILTPRRLTKSQEMLLNHIRLLAEVCLASLRSGQRTHDRQVNQYKIEDL